MQKIILIIFCILTAHCFAISEVNYQSIYNQSVFPFIKAFESKKFISHDGVKIHYLVDSKSEENQNCLVILPGQSESAIQYAELAFDINQSNFGMKTKIFILDIRGQGESDRTANPSDMGHVDYFSDYTIDLEYFFENVINSANCQKKFLFAHSMGAGIALSYLVKHSEYFNAVAISSPMLKVVTSPLPYLFVNSLVAEEVLRGHGAKFAIGQKAFNANETFEENDYTNSKSRHEMMMNLYLQYPETQIGGLSNRWVYEVMKETRHRRKYYKKITTPIKMYRAGLESTVSTKEMLLFCREAINCNEEFIKTARHAIFNDQDSVRNLAVNSLLDFFQQY